MPGTQQTLATLRVPVPTTWPERAKRVEWLCPGLADVGKTGGPVSNLLFPVSFTKTADFVTHSAVPVSISADSPSNSATCVSNTAELQLTIPRSTKADAAVVVTHSAESVSNSAGSELIEARAVNCCRARQHCEIPTQSITETRGGGGGGYPSMPRAPRALLATGHQLLATRYHLPASFSISRIAFTSVSQLTHFQSLDFGGRPEHT
jgi:hypothetical protein